MSNPWDTGPTPACGLGEAAPPTIPGFSINRLLGRGGLGRVYHATNTKDGSDVAIKIHAVNPGSTQARTILLDEAVKLRSLQHPNIVKYRSVSFFEDHAGQVNLYLAMEFIQGDTLDDYLKSHACDRAEKELLLLQIVNAVAAACKANVAHRDLKPRNILVTPDGVVKVVDWGLAAQVADSGQLLHNAPPGGTLPYMSPEQIESMMSAATTPTAVDSKATTRLSDISVLISESGFKSDVYSLGLIAYEMFAGDLPYRFPTSLNWDAIRDVLGRKAPDAVPGAKYSVSQVIVKALRRGTGTSKEHDRYENAIAFHADLESAAIPLARRAWASVARHRLPLGIAALLAVFSTVAAVGWKNAVQAQAVADQSVRREAEAAAASNAARSLFCQSIVLLTPSVQPIPAAQPVRPLLQGTIHQLDSGIYQDAPNVEASLRDAVGQLCLQTGDLNEAERQLRLSLKLSLNLLGDEHPDVAATRNNLAVALLKQSTQLDEALTLVTAAVDGFEKCGDSKRFELGRSLSTLGLIQLHRGKPREALAPLERSLELAKRGIPPNQISIASVLVNIGEAARNIGDYDRSEQCLREGLSILRATVGTSYPDTSIAINDLAALLKETGNLAEARTLFLEALELQKRIWGDQSPELADVLNNLGELQAFSPGSARDEQEAAERTFQNLDGLLSGRRGYEIKRAKILCNYGTLLGNQGRWNEAVTILERAEREGRPAFGVNRDDLAPILAPLGLSYLHLQRFSDAERVCRECLEIREYMGSRATWTLANTRSLLGAALEGQGKSTEAEPLLIAGASELLEYRGAPRSRQIEAFDRLVNYLKNHPDGDTAKLQFWQARLDEAQAPAVRPPTR